MHAGHKVAFCASTGLIVGGLGPWVNAFGGVVYGAQGTPGILCAVLGAASLLIFVFVGGRKARAWWPVAFFAMALVIMVANVVVAMDRENPMRLFGELGFGLYLGMLSSAVGIIAALLGNRESRQT